MSAIPGRATSRSHPSPIKTVVVYRNGDEFFPGRRFVINPRQVSSFNSFLNTVTGGVEAPFGAVRNVYTPREGHRIQSLETLQHGEKYVAGGTERFKKINYFHITLKKPQRKKSEVIKPVVHSRIIVPARWRKFLHESCTINVFTNGDVLVPPARILIPKYTLRSWERVLAMVTEKVHLRTGAVHRLYTLDGTPLSGSVELENNHYYVATGVERFRLLPYFHWVPRKGLIQDIGLGVHSDFLPPVMRKGKQHTRELIADHRQQADSLFNPKSERERAARAAMKQQPVSTTSNPLLLLSSGEDSVFKAKSRRRETVGVAEIQEDGQLTVDLPIDQVEAKVVEEQCDVIMALSPQPDSGGGETFCSIVPKSASSKKNVKKAPKVAARAEDTRRQ
ncbi:doublecortin domain-containing protein 2 isoform X2 [Salmo salar]|uniref:Doublecortin domain-containing protein 2 isoform X2 n=1 Tax=Salmo salar TaxID=8030 RepID=A0A1S3M8S8_SALSA|nr:doublecortin domain-containing protein 2-like isoform X2 [Salmo salar]|eukprot:XP_013999505.1 PREDICTED: doublecortin domain-containing protein 2-like isoform X2 [Salmo salar]